MTSAKYKKIEHSWLNEISNIPNSVFLLSSVDNN